MNIKTIDNLKPGVKADLLVSFFFENEKIDSIKKEMNNTTYMIIKSAFQQKEFTGKINQSILIRCNENINKILQKNN